MASTDVAWVATEGSQEEPAFSSLWEGLDAYSCSLATFALSRLTPDTSISIALGPMSSCGILDCINDTGIASEEDNLTRFSAVLAASTSDQFTQASYDMAPNELLVNQLRHVQWYADLHDIR